MPTCKEKLILFELYKLLLIERENDGKRLWVLFGLMNVINGALLAFVATKELEPGITKSLIALLGVVVSLFWFGTTLRMTEWIKWWESKLQDLEISAFETAKEKGESIPDGFTIFQGRKLTCEKGLSTKWVSYSMPIIFLLAWLLLLADKV